MTILLANSPPSGWWVESIIGGSTLLVAIIFGLSGIIFRYRPAAFAGGIVAFLVALFWIFCAFYNDTPGAARSATFSTLIGVAFFVFRRSPKVR
jgi:hypothetical protein